MRVGIDYALRNTSTDYYLFVNDDVAFESTVIEDMIAEYEAKTKADNCKAMVGATYDDECKLSYGDNMKWPPDCRFVDLPVNC